MKPSTRHRNHYTAQAIQGLVDRARRAASGLARLRTELAKAQREAGCYRG